MIVTTNLTLTYSNLVMFNKTRPITQLDENILYFFAYDTYNQTRPKPEQPKPLSINIAKKGGKKMC